MNAIKMLIPPKPVLEDAIGYHGEARYISLWWEPAGDEAMLSDGRVTFCADWWSYIALTDANQVNLMPYRLGSSDEPAEHRLVIDLVERTAFAGNWKEIERFVQKQWPNSDRPAIVRNVTSEELEELIGHLQEQMRKIRGGQACTVAAAWKQSREAYDRLAAWLREHNGQWCVRCQAADAETPASYRVIQVSRANLAAGEPMAEWPVTFTRWADAVRVATLLERKSMPQRKAGIEAAAAQKIGSGHLRAVDYEDDRDY